MNECWWAVELVILISVACRANGQNTISSYIESLLHSPHRFFLLAHLGKWDPSNFLQTVHSQLLDKYSIVYLNFSSGCHFFDDLKRQIQETGHEHGIKLFKTDIALDQLTYLITGLSKRKRVYRESVIVLVDEYDWPMRMQLASENIEKAREIHKFLRSFFGLLRANASKLKLVFMTGKMRVRSTEFKNGVNIFVDLTEDPEFRTLGGLTAESTPPDKTDSNFEEVVQTMKKMYRDHEFDCDAPNSDSVNIDQFWHASRPPTYIFDPFSERYVLVDAISRTRTSREHLLIPYDPNEDFPIEVFMLLKGYLTYCDYDNETHEFIIDYPNTDAKLGFVRNMWRSHIRARTQFAISPVAFKQLMVDGRIREIIQHLNQLSVLNIRYPEEYQLGKMVASILHVCQIGSRIGHRFRRQDSTLAGDIDLETLDLPVNYVIEFKWLKTAEKAFEKLLKYSNVTSFQHAYAGKTVYLIGINFGYVGDRIMVNEWIKVRYADGRCAGLETSNEDYAKKFDHVTRPDSFCNTLYRYESS